MTVRRTLQVDGQTGEIFEGAQLALIFPKRRNGFADGWVAMAQNPMKKLAAADLGDEARRVLFVVLAELDFENWISLNQARCAGEIGMARQNFARGLRRLVDEGVILEGPRVGRQVTFRLDPAYGWKGSATGHRQALAERAKARGLAVVEGGRRDPA